jgi:phage terminase large subunit-like protein
LPKKNGKTILGSGLAIADTIIRGEQGGEVYAFATKADQAKLAWDGFDKLLRNHKDFKKYYKVAYSTITFTKNETVFKKLGKDSTGDGIDGISCSFGLADEKHAHKDKKVEENVVSSMASRLQPHLMSISTAGFDPLSPYFEDYEYAKKVLLGVLEDDNLFVFIAEPPTKPTGDKFNNFYFHPKVWELSNPNYGISIKKDFMERQAIDAKNKPNKYQGFLVKRLNVWTNNEDDFISLDDWDRCQGAVDATGEFVGGMDLSLVDDFTSFMQVYKKGNKYHIKSNFYIPKEGIRKRETTLRVNLTDWVMQGYITATEGKSINYIYIYNDILKNIDNMKALCYDVYKAKSLIKLIEEPLDQELMLEFDESLDKNNLEQYNGTYDDCIPITQGFAMLSEPTMLLKKMVEDGRIVHDGNPVLKWMISNIETVRSPQGNIMITKARREKKIDGVAGVLNALALLLHKDEYKEPNVYETEGRGFVEV